MSSAPAAVPLRLPRTPALRILIIDDDQTDRLALRRCFQKAGVSSTIEEVGSAQEALYRVRPYAYDCVFLDYFLPGEDGISLLHSIHRLAPDLPVVILTGHGDENLAVEFMKAGAGDYLPKSSLSPDRIATSLRHAMQMAKISAAKQRAEEELRSQEAQFRILANAIPQLAWMTDADGALQWCNKRWYEYTGSTLEEVKGWQWKSFIAPEDADRVIEYFRECCARGEQWEDTYALRRFDGQYRRFLSLAVPSRKADGSIAGWLGTNTDITERVSVEEALRKNELLLAGQKTALELAISGVHRDEVLDCIAHKAQQQAGRESRTAIFLVDANGQHLQFAATAGMSADYARVVALLDIGPRTPSCGLAVHSGQPVITTDVLSDPLWAPYLEVAQRHRIRSCWSFPICSFFGRVLGTLDVYHSASCEPSRADLESLKLLCDTAALVIEQHSAEERRKQAEREVQQSAERQKITSEALARLLATEDIDTIVRELFPIVATHLHVDMYFNYMVKPGEGRMRLQSYAGISEATALDIELLGFGQAICGTVAETRQTIVATDIQHSDDEKTALVRGLGAQTYVCNPLLSGGELLGTISFASRKRTRFHDHELDFLRVISDYMALAMHKLRATEALRASEERFRSIFEQTTGGITQTDLQGRFILANDRYCEIVGRSREELMDLRVADITHPDDLVHSMALFQALAEGAGGNFVLEKRYVRPDGSTVWVRNHVSAVRNRDGNITSLAAASTDITEMKNAEAALRESDQQFMQLAESIPQLAWMADRSGQRFWYNQRWFDYTGTSADVQGEDWQRLHHPQHLDRVVAGLERSFTSGEAWEDTFPLRGRGGNYRWFLGRAVPIRSEEGRVVRWVGTNTDITELRDAEDALRRSEAIAATGRMAHGMAHEINNPLAAVTNLHYLIANNPELTETNREQIKTAIAELGRVSNIVKQTLGLYSKMAKSAPVNICRLLDDILRTMQPTISDKRVSVVKRFDWTGEIVIQEPGIQQTLWSVLENAIDAVDSGGRIVLHVCRSTEYGGKRRDGTRIIIADDGCGMTPVEHANAFEPFFTTKGRNGRGLGLWAAQDVIVRYGGTVRFRTSTVPGRSGTCCSIFLPLQRGEANQNP